MELHIWLMMHVYRVFTLIPSSLATCAAGIPDCTRLHASSLNSILYVCAIIHPPDFLDRLYHSFYVSIKWGIRQKPVEAIERLVQDTLVPLKERRYKGEKLAVSDEFSDIVAKGMAVKREERYQSVSEVLRDINKLSEEKITEEKMEKQETQFVNPISAEENTTIDWNIWKQRVVATMWVLFGIIVIILQILQS